MQRAHSTPTGAVQAFLALLLIVSCQAIAQPREFPSAPPPRPLTPDPVSVMVDINGSRIHVQATVHFPAPRELVWAVVTDYEHMSRFISNLVQSNVIERSASRAHVIQKGKASFGPITFEFDSEREIELHPPEKAVSRLLRGNLKSYTGITVLESEGTGTKLSFSSDAVTDAFIPPIIGKRFVENESREQFAEIFTEVQRRQNETPVSK